MNPSTLPSIDAPRPTPNLIVSPVTAACIPIPPLVLTEKSYHAISLILSTQWDVGEASRILSMSQIPPHDGRTFALVHRVAEILREHGWKTGAEAEYLGPHTDAWIVVLRPAHLPPAVRMGPHGWRPIVLNSDGYAIQGEVEIPPTSTDGILGEPTP